MTPSLLPTELWTCVLRFATFDGTDYDLGMPDIGRETSRTDSIDMKTKVAITRVSRLYNQIASAFLFEHVRIEDASRAFRLCRRLSWLPAAGPDGPRQWIKVLVVHPVDDWDDSAMPPMARMVANILRLCLDLRTFFWFYPNRDENFRNRTLSEEKMLAHIPGNIQVFRWSSDMDLHCSTLSTVLRRTSTTLRVLVITGVILCDCSDVHIPIMFPSLTHLTLGGSNQWSDSLYSLGPMPSLTEFTLRVDYDYTIVEILAPEWTRTVRILRMDAPVGDGSTIFGPVLRACPVLQEIHYHSDCGYPSFTPWGSDLNHPKLQHLRVSITGGRYSPYADLQCARSGLRQYFRNISACRFPLLEAITVDRVPLGESELTCTDTTCVMLRRVSDDFSTAELSVT